MTPHSNAHLWTAAAYYLIAAVLLWTGFRLYMAHPINRVFMLGRFVTKDGLHLVLRHWWLVPLFGAFILSCALEHHADWLLRRGSPLVTPEVVADLGIAESLISVATAIACLVLRVRAWLS